MQGSRQKKIETMIEWDTKLMHGIRRGRITLQIKHREQYPNRTQNHKENETTSPYKFYCMIFNVMFKMYTVFKIFFANVQWYIAKF